MPERSKATNEGGSMNAQSTIQFDLASVPREIRDDLARPLVLAVDAYFKQPGVEEKFQQWLVEYKKRSPGNQAGL